MTYGTGTIRGTVTMTGGPLPSDARLILLATRVGQSNASGGTTGDSRGRFVITNLAAGTYEVILQKFPPVPSQPGKHPPAPIKQIVTVADGAETEITFTLNLSSEGGP